MAVMAVYLFKEKNILLKVLPMVEMVVEVVM
jgi:hypothetical protein